MDGPECCNCNYGERPCTCLCHVEGGDNIENFDLDEPVMTRREALDQAYSHLSAVVAYCLDLGLTPDKVDWDHIREAHRLVALARKE